jgi:hypothetical protein
MNTPEISSARLRGMMRLVAILWVLFWLLMIVDSVQANWDDPNIYWWEPIVIEGTSALGASLTFSLFLRFSMRYTPYLHQPLHWFFHHLKWLPLLLLCFVATTYGLRYGVYVLFNESYVHNPWLIIFGEEAPKFALFYGLWLGIIFGIYSFLDLIEHREYLLQAQKALADSQLAQLKAQLKPHFLFNTLNTISSFIQVDAARADQLISQLAVLLRASLNASEQNTVPLSKELNLLKLYGDIMQARFGSRATLSWCIADNTLNAQIPTMILQPLLENAYQHGVESSCNIEKICIQSFGDNCMLHLIVHNTGPMLANPLCEGVGLRNCRERLHVLYGLNAQLILTNDTTGGVSAKISLPWSAEK